MSYPLIISYGSLVQDGIDDVLRQVLAPRNEPLPERHEKGHYDAKRESGSKVVLENRCFEWTMCKKDLFKARSDYNDSAATSN